MEPSISQHPDLIVEITPAGGPDDLWIECRTCGRASYQSKGQVAHKRGCKTSSAQYGAAPAAAPAELELGRAEELRCFARNVRQTGQTKGRDQDVLEAVRQGYLSESDAMNTDD